jgi:hypothetical protein
MVHANDDWGQSILMKRVILQVQNIVLIYSSVLQQSFYFQKTGKRTPEKITEENGN